MNIHLPPIYVHVHQGYRVLTHAHLSNKCPDRPINDCTASTREVANWGPKPWLVKWWTLWLPSHIIIDHH